MGYAFLEARKKGILLEKDFRERLKFARKVKRTYCNKFFMNDNISHSTTLEPLKVKSGGKERRDCL